jgi:hypothetical protein
MAKKASETWRQFALLSTNHLKTLQEGTTVMNIVSKNKATATEKVNRHHPYIQVSRKVAGRTIYTSWFAGNVSIVK